MTDLHLSRTWGGLASGAPADPHASTGAAQRPAVKGADLVAKIMWPVVIQPSKATR